MYLVGPTCKGARLTANIFIHFYHSGPGAHSSLLDPPTPMKLNKEASSATKWLNSGLSCRHMQHVSYGHAINRTSILNFFLNCMVYYRGHTHMAL